MMSNARRAGLLVLAASALMAVWLVGGTAGQTPDPTPAPGEREAMFYEKLPDGRVQCKLCPRMCIIPQGGRGVCRVRENRGGTLYSVVWGKPCTVTVEPIEKAPFYHFMPGSRRVCVATVGCNQSCKYCQNWQISQRAPEEVRSHEILPAQLVAHASKNDIPIICFTFSEPIVFYEYVYDTAQLAREAGIKIAVVTGGYINPEPLKKLLPFLDAVKIDLKGFDRGFFRDIVGGQLEPVLEALQIVHKSGTHLEIVNLVVPTLNDNPDKIREMCEWIKDNIGVAHPIHFTRFHPSYRLTNLPPTPVSTLEKAAEIARKVGLKYVFIGNVPGHEMNSTFCPNCGKRIIHRVAFHVLGNGLKGGKCPHCNQQIYGVWGAGGAAVEGEKTSAD